MTPTTRRRKQEQDQALQQAMQEAATPLESKSRKISVRFQDDVPSSPSHHDQASSSKEPSALAISQVTSFDDEQETLKMQNATAPLDASSKSTQLPEEDAEDDDDAAPETMSTHVAATEVKQSALAAQKMAQEQAAQQKRKRQHRDTLFKQQAAERQRAKTEAVAIPTSTSRRKRRSEKLHIPDVLPAEFLTDSSGEDEEDEEEVTSLKVKRRDVNTVERQLTQLGRGPKDKVVGNTIYRVAKKTDEKMPPKLKKYALNSKNQLLRRNRATVQSSPGFFKTKT